MSQAKVEPAEKTTPALLFKLFSFIV